MLTILKTLSLNRASLEALANRLGAGARIFSLDNRDAVARVRNARKISIALHVAGSMSRGLATSARQNVLTETLHLVDGELVTRSPEDLRDFDFGSGPRSAFPVTLSDLVTIHHTTGESDIETFVHVSVGAFLTGDTKDLPAGPSFEEREASVICGRRSHRRRWDGRAFGARHG